MSKPNIINHRFKKQLLFAAMVLFSALPFTVKAQDGSSTDPFPIKTAQQLTSLAQRINAGGTFYFNPADSMYYASTGTGYVSIPNAGEDRYFKLTDDIALNSGDMASCDGVLPSGATAWIVLGNSDTHPFDGVLDGNYHTISGMYVKSDGANAGFIGITGNHAKIRNLGIIKSYVAGDNTCGGLIGTALHAEVDNCFFAGTVEGVGTSAAAGTIVGGLIGEASTTTKVTHCFTNAMVSGKSQVGGLVGRTVGAGDPCTFRDCYSSSTVYGQFSYTGGAIGEDRHASTVITNLYYDSQMVSIPAGVTADPTSLKGTAMNTVDMTDGTWAPSGFTVQTGNIYPVITGFDPSTNPDIYLTLVPIFLPTGSSLSNLTAVSSVTLGGQPGGVTWTLMEGVGTVTHSNYTLTVDGQSYVVLQATHSGATRSYVFRFDKDPLLGTAANPFTIDNLAQLTLFRDGINTGLPFKYKHFTIPAKGEGTYFLQTNNIDLSSGSFESIGVSSSTPFKGTYDGGNHAVTGWQYTSGAYAFFRYTDQATIENLTMRNVRSATNASLIYSMKGGLVYNCHAEGSNTVKGGLIFETPLGDYTATIRKCTNSNNCAGLSIVGGIVSEIGSVHNIIDSCHNYGNVVCTSSWGGGIVGGEKFQSGSEITVTNCSNRGVVSHTSSAKEKYLGGIVGLSQNCTISYCRNIGKVTGKCQYVAGILGYGTANSSVSYCYNVGEVSSTPPSNVGVYVYGIAGNASIVTHCVNAGKVINITEKSTYAISSGSSNVCINAGDVSGGTDGTYAFANNTTNRDNHYSIGRLQGGGNTYLGGCYVDTLRVPSYVSSTNAYKRNTSTLTGASVSPFASNTTDWICSAGVYPRIKGLEDDTLSKVLALPIIFTGSDNVDNVTSDFTVRSQWGIVWSIEGTSGATISATPVDNYQTVTLPANRTNGNIILKARFEDTCCYRITLVMGVTPPDTALTVNNLTELMALRTGINSGMPFTYRNAAVPAGGKGTTFRLTTNIGINNDWTPIGTEIHPFEGTFDGDGHNISGMRQINLTYSGLFGYVHNGTVTNLNLLSVNINSPQQTGGICTYLQGGVISNCRVSGDFKYSSEVADAIKYRGGIAAVISDGAKVTNCFNEANLKGAVSAHVGGIVGRALSTSCVIEKCINAGSITNVQNGAGICSYGGTIKQCVNYGSVTGIPRSSYVAGISARSSVIESCVNSGKISVPQIAGTITCYVSGIGAYDESVSYCYNVGEIVGNNAYRSTGIYYAACTQCYNAGKVTGDVARPISYNSSTKCYYDSQTSVATGGGGTAKTTAEMLGSGLSATSMLGTDKFVYSTGMYPRIKGIENWPASWATAAPVILVSPETVSLVNSDFELGGCDHVVWSVEAGTAVQIDNSDCEATIATPGIPTLCVAVNDTIYKRVQLNLRMDALIIKDSLEFEHFRTGINSGNVFYYNASDSTFHTTNEGGSLISVLPGGESTTFRLHKDIDFRGNTWTNPIGVSASKPFKGSFDGNGKHISNYKLHNIKYSGLFGYVENGNILDLELSGVTGSMNNTEYHGVLAGYVLGTTIDEITITNCEISSNKQHLGTLVGYMEQSAASHIDLESNTLTGTSNVGGVAGYGNVLQLENVEVNNCAITASGSSVGGVCGATATHSSQFKYVTVNNIEIEATGEGTTNIAGICGSSTSATFSYVVVNGGIINAENCDIVGGITGTGNCLNLSYSSNSATVIGRDRVSGIFAQQGSCNPSLLYVTNTGDVYGRNYVSGIFSYEGSSTRFIQVYNCVNSGNITGEDYVGGIRAKGYYITDKGTHDCVNTGDVTGNRYVGGIVGYNESGAYNCLNAGRVKGNQYVGGIVGQQKQHSGATNKTNQCLSVGQVYGEEYVGNVVGDYEVATVTNCYYDKQMSPNNKGVGTTGEDITGIAEGVMTNNILNTGIQSGLGSGFTYSSGLYPRPKTIKDSIGAIVAATPVVLADTVTAYTIPGRQGYAVTPSTANSVVWNQMAGHTNFFWQSPSFKAQRAGMTVLTASRGQFAKNVDFVVGVSSEMPCIIKNDVQLTNFTNYINAGTPFYYNTEDSTFAATAGAAGIEWIPIAAGGEGFFFKLDFDPTFGPGSEWTNRIGTPAAPFKGDFNGDHHIVSNLPSANADTCGFFGCNAGTIRNLVINNANMSDDRHNTVAALCGYNSGRIDSCSVKNCEVNGNNVVAAIAAINTGYVSACYSSSTVNGNDTVAGICAVNTGSITSTFNMGDITADTYAGGIAGVNTGSLANTYNVGNITASDYAGGLAGKTGTNLATSYNAGQVNCSGSNAGGIAGNISGSNVTAITSVAYDDAMCTLPSSFQGGNSYNTVKTSTQNMVGSGLQSTLGSADWVFTANMYPRLRGMDTLNASQLSATPIFLTPGENVQNVCHDFTVSNNNNTVTWAQVSSDALVMDGIPSIVLDHCGTPTLQATRGDEQKNIPLQINFTGAVEQRDTTCGEPYLWEVSGLTYNTTHTAVVNRTVDGCPYTYTLHVVIPAELKVNVTSEPETCVDANDGTATATVTGGLGSSYTYEWTDLDSNRATPLPATATITGLAPEHEYRVIVTDALNTKHCTVRDSIEVEAAVPLVASIDSVSAGCYGSVDGMFEVSFSGGKANYVLSWSGASTGSRGLTDPQVHYAVTGLNNGNHTVVVRDSNNCTTTLTANLVEDSREYTITAFDTTKLYDGVAVNAARYTLNYGTTTHSKVASGSSITLDNGDVLTATVSQTNPTNAGIYSNQVNSYVVMRGSEDVTCQYNITPVNKNVVITKRNVIITSADSSKFYNTTSPTPLTNHRVIVSGDRFTAADSALITYNFHGSQTVGGVSDNDFDIEWNGVNPNNYTVTKVYGTLTVIENGMLIVRAKSLNRTYDGTSETYTSQENVGYTVTAYYVRMPGDPGYNGINNQPDTVYGLGPQYRVEVEMNNGVDVTMKDADTVDWRVTSIHAYFNDGVEDHDVTMSFRTRDTIHGVLQINPVEITMTSDGGTWVYDGTTHTLPEVTMVGSFVSGEISGTPTATGSITNVGKVTNTISFTPTGNYLAKNYRITKTEDTLKVTKRPLNISGVDTYVDYTGSEQTTTDFTYSNLVSGHTATGVSFSASGTEVGEYVGAFVGKESLSVVDGSNNDVTANYDTVYTPGTLYIRSLIKELRVASATVSEMYDGQPHTAQTYTVNFGYQPMPSVVDNLHFKLTTGDTVVIIPGSASRTDVGSVRNDFDLTIRPAEHFANYTNIVRDTGTINVTPREVILRSLSLTKTYDGTAIVYDTAVAVGNGFVEGQGASYTFSNPRTYIEVGTYPNAFDYSLNAGTNPANYTFVKDTGSLVITPAVLTVKAVDITRTYGEPNVFDYTITGYQGSDDVSVVTGLDATHPSYDCDGGQYANIGTYTITPVLTGLSAGNYTLEPADGNLTIQRRVLTVNAPSVTAAYDGNTHNQTTNPILGTITYTNLASGDVVTHVAMSYSRVDGGETPMTYSSITIMHDGVDVTANYNVLVSDTSKLIITKRDLTVKVKDTTKVYDGTALVPEYYEIVAGELASGDAISNVTYTGTQTAVGTSASSFSQIRIVRGGNDVDVSSLCYDLVLNDGVLTVTPKSVTVTANPKEKVYGASDPTLTATVMGLLGSDVVTYTLSRAAGEAVGKYAITPTGAATQGNYSVTYVEDSLTITKANLVVNVQDATKVYGESDPTFTATLSGLQNGDTQADILTLLDLQFTRTSGENVGTYTISATGNALTNYNVTYNTGTLTITKAELTVTADDQSKVFGTADPTFTATLSGLQNGDTQAAILTALGLSFSRESGENVGTYVITASGPSTLSNYTVDYVQGSLEITPAALTIIINATKEYDATAFVTSYLQAAATTTGLVTGDHLTAGEVTTNAATVGVYTYPSTSAITTPFATSLGIDNYNVSYNITQTITQKALTITANSDSKVYDGTALTNNGYTNTTLATGDHIESVTVTGSQTVVGTSNNVPSAAVIKNASNVDVTASYDITYANGTLEVTQKALTITANSDSKVYDGTALTNSGYTNTTLATGDNIESVTVTGSQTVVGTSNNVPSAAVIKNASDVDVTACYDITYSNGTLEVTQKALTITANSDSKVYDGTALTNSGYTNTALASTDHIENVTVTGSQTVVGTSNNVPSAAVIKNASDEDVTASYDITYANGTLEVTKKAITITADDKTKVYDNDASTDPALTATVTGVPTSGVAPVYTLSRTAGQTVGNYTITVTAEAASNPNYTITTETGTFSITPRDLTIKLDTTKVYDGTVFVSTYAATGAGYTVTGLQNGATITAGVVTSSAKDVATYIDSVATNYAEVTTAFATSDGITNYNVTYDLKQVITPRELTIKLDTTKVYEGLQFVSDYTATTDGYTVTGLQNGATVTAGVVTSSAKDVATYIDSVATNYAEVTTAFATSDGISNYNVIYDLKQVITPRELTIKLDTTKVYDGMAFVSTYAATGAGYTVTGLQNGATITAGVVTSPSANVGTYTDNTGANITTAFETNDDITNYNVSYDFTQVITPRPGVVVTIQEHGAEVEFNGTDQRVTGYSVSIADPINLYTVADFSFIGMVGDSIAHGTGSADALHIYDMNLRPAYFRNDNTNYMNVTFQISDSALYIYPNLKAEATTTQVFCHTGNNGTATIEVTGGKQHFGKYYFSFEGGTPVEFESPHTYTDLQEGNYSVEVTDSLGYHVTVNFSITEVEQLVATIVTPTDLCPNQGSYPVRVNVTGGTTPYTYTWTGAQAVDADATQVMQVAVNDGEETYAVSVSVLDAHNCPAADDATFTVKSSVEKVGSVTYTCSNDTSVTLRYGVYDTLIILNQPTWTSNIPAMPLTLVPEGKPVTDRYAVPEGREDTTYIVKWHIVDTCGGDTLICTQHITVAFPSCAGTVNDANGNSYEVIRLGANCWTKPNYLAVPEPIRSTRASSNGTYKYNNDDALFNEYGYLYTWYAVCHLPENNNSVSPTVVDGHIPGICPAGWALPTVEDYVIMVEAAGGLPHVKAADDSYWITGLEGSVPSSGFDALGAGYYKSATDSYEGLKTTARFWTATPSGNATDGVAVQCGVCESEEVLMIPKADGCSLRCVKINP